MKRARILSILLFGLMLLLNGCAMFHGWFGVGGRQPVSGGASVTVPLGGGGGR